MAQSVFYIYEYVGLKPYLLPFPKKILVSPPPVTVKFYYVYLLFCFYFAPFLYFMISNNFIFTFISPPSDFLSFFLFPFS